MNFFVNLGHGLIEIWAHKFRSLLSMICVALGVASLVIVSGFIQGMFDGWKVAMSSAGGLEKIWVDDKPLPPRQRHLQGVSRGKTLEDAEAIESLSRYAVAVSPEIEDRNARLTHGDRSTRTRVEGVRQAILEINDYEVERGRFFSDLDQERARRVVVLGSEPLEELFGDSTDALGATIKINEEPFEIIGLLPHYELNRYGWNMLRRKNQKAFVPVTTMQRLFTGNDQISNLNIKVGNIADLPQLIDETRNILLQTHRGLEDFEIRTMEERYERYETTRNSWFTAGAAIAIVSLVVGGIGIMNLMLATIQERIREIGIRKAVGAWGSDIFSLFLTEAVVLSLLGGLLGIALGRGAIHLMGAAMADTGAPVFSVSTAITGFVFSVIMGVFAGIYPAIEAARLDPIDALRTD